LKCGFSEIMYTVYTEEFSMVNDTEELEISRLANMIIAQTLAGSTNLLYCLRMTNTRLNPYQKQLVKDQVLHGLIGY